MDAKILNSVSQYLYPKNDDGQNLFKSMYDAKVHGNYDGNAGELLKASIENIPSYAVENTAFAYRVSNQLMPTFLQYIEQDKNQDKDKKDSTSPQQAHQAAKQAVSKAMADLGYEQSVDGQKEQDDLIEEIEGNGDQLVKGLLASKNPSAHGIAKAIKSIDTSIQSLQKTLKSVSAISDSLVKGLEKVKSEYSESGFDYGRDLSKIDPSEYSYLQQGYSQIFMLKYAKGELLQESSIDKKGLGDIIIAVDTSGSAFTNARDDYEVIDLEMGIAMAISKIAAKNKCKVRICLYHTKLHHDSGWLRGKEEITQAFAKIYSGKEIESGGTSFDNAINGICDRLEISQYPSSRKPGIIFITDGYDSMNSDTVDRVKEIRNLYGINMYSYFVSKSNPKEYAEDLVMSSKASYWINARKEIDKQLDAFVEIV